MSSLRERISEILVSQRVISRDQLDRLAAEAVTSRKDFARMLIERGIISESKLTELLAQELSIPAVNLTKYRIDPEVAKLVPERVARQYHLIALTKFGDRLVVAMSDPLNIFALDDLKVLTQVAIDPVLSSETDIVNAIERIYLHEERAGTPAEKLTKGGPTADDSSLDTAVAMLLSDEQEGDVPVVKVINLMIMEAMRRQASDIHLEPLERSVRVRYRIDGRLVEGHRLPKVVQGAILSRLKIMAGMDITESRLPQDGRFRVRLEQHEVDFRVSELPVTQGNKVVLRLLDRSNLSIGLENLGFLPESIERFEQAITRPFGMILVTGPTGSGKSTTLYCILSQLNEPTRNVVTVEDPVEYQLEGATQVQVNPEVGLTFASGLRALLRQSPDVVMIGEIRDFETADIAMKASLTGQLVLSTLHTNDAASAVTRLVDMGVEPFLVASSVSLIQAQRLVRKLCTKCRKPVDPPKALLEKLELKPGKDATFFSAVGCRLCADSGFKGRMGIIEVCVVDERIRELIVTRAQSWEIKGHAVKALGMTTLHRDGLKKAEAGLTTLEEVLMVTSEE